MGRLEETIIYSKIEKYVNSLIGARNDVPVKNRDKYESWAVFSITSAVTMAAHRKSVKEKDKLISKYTKMFKDGME